MVYDTGYAVSNYLSLSRPNPCLPGVITNPYKAKASACCVPFWSLCNRVNDYHLVGGVPSQMKLKGWECELSRESDPYLRSYLHKGVLNGFDIIDDDVCISSYSARNYSSVLKGEANAFINKLIMSELDECKYVIANKVPHCIHALGAVPKKDGGYRPITDCRQPLGNSINNHMDTTFQSFKYKSVDDVCNLMFPGCYLASIDISSAYRSVSVNLRHWTYQGATWTIDNTETFIMDTRLCFGLRCAPFIFTTISDFIVRCMNRRGHYFIVNYLDNFCVGGATFEECQKAQIDLISILGSLGFYVNWKKCSSPSQTIVYLIKS